MFLKSASELEEILKKEILSCVKCGNCHAACPTFRHDPREESGMRGKIALLQAAEKGRTLSSRDALRVLANCVNCKSCRSFCPNGIDTLLVKLLGNWRLSGKSLFELPTPLYAPIRLTEIAARSLFDDQFAHDVGFPLIREILTDDLTEKSNSNVHADENTILKKSETIVFLPECGERTDPSLTEKAKAILDYLDIKNLSVHNQGCCGSAALDIADLRLHQILMQSLFRQLLSQNIETLVVACPRCLESFRYAKILYQLSENEEKLLGKVTDLYSFLAARQWKPKRRIEGKYTYQDPCLLVRGPSGKKSPRELLKKVLSQHLIESYRDGVCCGYNHDSLISPTADKICAERTSQLFATGADKFITSCSDCLKNLSRDFGQFSIQGIHMIDIIHESIR